MSIGKDLHRDDWHGLTPVADKFAGAANFGKA
jgi:hypothetical protein